MRLSESSDDQVFNAANVDGADQQVLSSLKETSHADPRSGQAHNGQPQLLPVAMVCDEEDVTVLREQLQAAHRLLQYQQGVVDSLTEQLVSCQTHLTQVEHDLEESQERCTQQTAKIDDVESICHDLKAQLRRQQNRIGEYRQVMQELDDVSLTLGTAGLTGVQSRLVAFDYDAGSIETNNSPTAVKSSPVKTWSAAEAEDLTGPVALYQKLAAMTVAAASHHSRVSRRYGQPVRQPLKSANTLAAQNYNPTASTSFRVELPSFIHS